MREVCVINESEIVGMYRSAADPGRQIDILADLNLTTPKVIREILKRNGLEIPDGSRKRGRPPRSGNPSSAAPSREWVLRVCCGRSVLDCEKAVDMYLAGRSDAEIADVFGVSSRTVCSWRCVCGLPTLYSWRKK